MYNKPSFQSYYQDVPRITQEFLDKENSEYLLQVDFEEYLNYLIERIKWQPLIWDENKITVEPFVIKQTRSDSFDRDSTIKIDVPKFRFRIPTQAHPQRDDYLRHTPSVFKFVREPEWKFENDTLIYEIVQSNNAKQQCLDDIRFYFGGRNKDIENGNKILPAQIRGIWAEKRKRLEEQRNSTQELLKELNIPLHQDPNAKIKPIEIKPRKIDTVIEKPKTVNKVEPNLKRDDVISLVDFIEQYTRQFEIAPKTYQKMYEEELRDLLVGMMNANYPGSTTGETFSKLGKTDILLRLNSGNVLICECKYWGGAKAYLGAIEQLFRYLTWRQNYGVLINFCKLKEMTSAVKEGKLAITNAPSFKAGQLYSQSETRFTSIHTHPQDNNKSVEIFHLFIDLSII
jgi:hypothetical protein